MVAAYNYFLLRIPKTWDSEELSDTEELSDKSALEPTLEFGFTEWPLYMQTTSVQVSDKLIKSSVTFSFLQ